MRIFVIHSGSDYDEIEKYLKNISRDTDNTEMLMLKNGGKLWKAEAKTKIRQAQLVLFFVGEKSHESDNIAWEINCAVRYQKPIITVKLKQSNLLHPALKRENNYTNEVCWINEEMSVEEVIQKVNDYSSGDYSLFNGDINDTERQKILLEQYKMFLKTSEDLVARRQSVSNFYISVNSALMAVLNMFLALNTQEIWKIVTSVGVPVIGIILCCTWIKLLHSYGELNSSKLKIIRIIEKQLPASLYDTEWRVQSDKLNLRPYVSFTKQESFIPKTFIFLYVLILCISAIVMILKFV